MPQIQTGELRVSLVVKLIRNQPDFNPSEDIQIERKLEVVHKQ